jgi:hypothetical protein
MLSTAFILALLIGPAAGPQQSAPQAPARPATEQPAPAPPTVNPDALPVDIEKIQRELARQPAIVIGTGDVAQESGMPTYRVRVEAQAPSIQEILGPDYLRGPVEAGPMRHQEFLDMVTPDQVRGYAAFSNGQAATVAITSLAMQWALKTALEKFNEARDERAKAEARKEVQDALEQLRKARLAAGLSDK